MKAVILAAGNGTRLYPLTLTTPKILTPVFNRPLVDHFIEILEEHCDEIIFVISQNKLSNDFITYAKSQNFSLKITFAVQDEQLGTGHALQCAEPLFDSNEKFIVMYGDDYYSKADVENLLKYEFALVGQVVSDPSKWGILQQDADGNLVQLIEKPQEFVGNLGNLGMYLVDSSIFDIFHQTVKSLRGEYEITDGITLFAQSKNMKVIESEFWQPLGYPWHILEVHERLADTVESQILGDVEKNVVMDGIIKLGKNSVIKAGTRLEGHAVIGDNVTVGPNCSLSGVNVIGDNTNIGPNTSVENSTLFKGVEIKSAASISNSIIGNKVVIEPNVVMKSEGPDGEAVITDIKGSMTDTGRTRFGAIVGDGTLIEANAVISPGVKIWPNATVGTNSNITKDIQIA